MSMKMKIVSKQGKDKNRIITCDSKGIPSAEERLIEFIYRIYCHNGNRRMNVSKIIVRSFSKAVANNAAAKREIAGGYKQMESKYKHFQLDNNLLVHQRGGTGDYVMFGITVAINIVGLVMCADVYYRMAFNKK